MVNVYISIGNSDGKLTPARWSEFWRATDQAISEAAMDTHGVWHSFPTQPYQNACWCVEFHGKAEVRVLKDRLRNLVALFGQDSIAWAEAETEFLSS